jgi:transposase-like protein
MVAAVRRGESLRRVARRFQVRLSTVQYWVTRAGGQRLDRVRWTDQRHAERTAPNRTPATLEARVLTVRQALRTSVLGEAGAAAIHAELLTDGGPVPCVRTIGRILVRHGQVDRRQRQRHPPPPAGWHLPGVGTRAVELDLFDFIEMLKLADGPMLDVFTTVALHRGWPGAWPLANATTTATLDCVIAHWRQVGCPGYAQMDNDTRFQGAHQHPDVFGRVVRLCLQLGVTPVFVPPREFGLQNAIESFNSLWQTKVWQRYHFGGLTDVATISAQYIAARRTRLAGRAAEAPARTPWPADWEWHPKRLPAGVVIYIRRTSEEGRITLLGHTWRVDPHWCHRLVRAEVDLGHHVIRCFALRRRAPDEQPLLHELPYRYPRADLYR